MRFVGLALALAAPGIDLFAAAQAEAHLRDLQAEDDECLVDGGAGEGCALSLRQLRIRGVAGATAAATAATAATDGLAAPASPAPAPTVAAGAAVTVAAPRPAAADRTAGVPGGWGEPSDFVAAVRAGQAGDATLWAQWWPGFGDWGGYGDAWRSSGSCAAYGCSNHYASSQVCQCNAACSKYGSCCKDYLYLCHGSAWQQPVPVPHYAPAPSPSHTRNIMTLYHQTDQHAANLIMWNGFQPGKGGWCGGAIYFATSPQATYTKAIGAQSHKGAMLQCQVNVGRVLYQDKHCGGSKHNQAELSRLGYDSISFNPGDGDEYVIWDKTRVLSIKQIPL